ncbi:Lysophospholipase [Saitozyma sp. JCM 24511]|nr:Lysophospholipase [Saitozyma sp. JCM 24511]
MLLTSPLLGTIVSGGLFALAAPTQDELARRELALTVLARAQQEGGPALEFARQLLGGGSSFAPYTVACPSNVTWVRSATGLSSGEQSYLAQRQQYIQTAVTAQAAAHGIPTPPRLPVIGFALSGGGYRAMQVGLGGVMGTMNQSAEAAASGIGGWFDAVSYQAGLSGGSWGTGSFMANGGALPTDLVNNVWDLSSNLILPSDNKVSFYYDLVSEVDAKDSTGFPVQLTDYWGLALGNHLLPTQYRLDTSPNLTFSQLPSAVPALGNASLPFPIIIAAEREPGEYVIAENATVWEFTPYEFGSWAFGSDTKVRGAFTPLEYLGSQVNNGQSNGTCWKGFDQLSFVMGTSSTLFNAGLLTLNGTNSDSVIVDAIQSVLSSLSANENDVALYPNSFANWNPQPNPISNFTYITLVDAGETNQNVPLEPLLIPYRETDAIIAFDSSADTTYSWPNGTALRTTYERAVVLAQNQNVSIRMPRVPSMNGFVNGGYNTRPTFFGCEANGTTPIIVYVPNYPWSYYGNTSTYQLSYDNATAQQVVLNGMRSFTLNGTVETWPKCLACALTDRSFGYTASNRSSECQQCFNTWCWDGTDNTTTPDTYEPVVGIAPSFLVQKNLTNATGTAAGVTATSGAAAATSKSAGDRAALVGSGLWAGVVLLSAALGGAWVVM